jgi:hypothetical protein
MSLPTPQPAPWREEFLEHLQQTPEFALSTISHEPSGGAEPRVRFCVCRGLLGAPPPPFPHPNGAAADETPGSTPPPGQPPGAPRPGFSLKTDCPVFTTDARMRKPAELRACPAVEAAWWCRSAGVQWRVRGVARMIGGGGGGGGEAEVEEGTEESRAALERRMYDVQAGPVRHRGGWTWAGEVAAWFASQSPRIRGVFSSRRRALSPVR